MATTKKSARKAARKTSTTKTAARKKAPAKEPENAAAAAQEAPATSPKKATRARKSAAKKAPQRASSTSQTASKKAAKKATRKAAKQPPAASTSTAEGKPKPAAKKATSPRKATAKKSASKRSVKTSANGSGTPAADAPAKSPRKKVAATELLKRKRHDTPAIFKVPNRRQVPVVFTLDDVREHLKTRREQAREAEAAAAAKTPAKQPARNAAPAAAQSDTTGVEVASGHHGAASLADILGMGAVAPAKDRKVDAAGREVPRKWQRYYKLLIELRDEVKNEVTEHSSDTLKRSQKEDTGDLSTSADSGSDNFDRDFALNLLSSEQEALKEIEAAIERIFDGTYGVCQITGQPIAKERLEAVPFTRYSLEGQREYERGARKRVQRTGAFLAEGSAEDATFTSDDDGDN